MTQPTARLPLAVRLLRIAAGGIAIALLALFTLWLLRHLYLDETWQQGMVRRYGAREDSGQMTGEREEKPSEWHLRPTQRVSLAAMPDPPVCNTCHGTHPHIANERLRAYLNMHGTFLACETCHHRPEPGEALDHAWIDDETDTLVNRPEGEHGLHGAHIYPVRRTEAGAERLGARLSEPEWMAFSERVAEASGQEHRALTERAHFELQGEPLGCGECHRPDGALDREALGYTPSEIERLAHLEMARFLESNADFHLPDLGGRVTPIPASP